MAKTLLLTCAAGLVAVALVAEGMPRPAPEAAESPVEAAAPTPPVPIGNFAGRVTLDRTADSHFYADAQVNGAQVRFLVDTGATSVVLTAADAQRAGIGGGDYNATGLGAGGTVRLKPVTLDRVAVGTLSASNVPAMVAEGDTLPVSLLGQSWLAALGTVTIEGDRMVLE